MSDKLKFTELISEKGYLFKEWFADFFSKLGVVGAAIVFLLAALGINLDQRYDIFSGAEATGGQIAEEDNHGDDEAAIEEPTELEVLFGDVVFTAANFCSLQLSGGETVATENDEFTLEELEELFLERSQLYVDAGGRRQDILPLEQICETASEEIPDEFEELPAFADPVEESDKDQVIPDADAVEGTDLLDEDDPRGGHDHA